MPIATPKAAPHAIVCNSAPMAIPKAIPTLKYPPLDFPDRLFIQ